MVYSIISFQIEMTVFTNEDFGASPGRLGHGWVIASHSILWDEIA